MSDMISKNHFQTKHCHCNSNGSSIWDRLPYNIGMEFHQCTNHIETQNDDEWLSSFYCHQQQLQKQQQQQPPPTTFLSTSSTLSTLSRLSSLEIFSHLNEDFNQKINKIEKTSSTMNENDENIQNDYDNRINPVYNRIVKRNNKNFNFNLNKKTTYAGDDHYDDDDGDGGNGDGDLNETTTSAECSSIRLKYELVSSIVANISTTSIITASNIPATTTTATTSTTTAAVAAAATRTTQTRSDLKDKSAPARTIHKNSKFFNNFYCKFRNDKLFVAILYLIVYILSSSKCLAARQDVATNCTFPARWEGSWFLSGYQQSIHIKGSQFSYRGKCAASDGNKFLIVDERGCHRCLVIYEKHKNVLQYKESECDGDSMYMDQSNPAAMPMRSILKSDHRGGAHPNLNGHSRLSLSDQYIMRSNDDMTDDYHCKGRETLQNLCDQIPGDALLYSLFRENAEPVKCPLKGPFVFTYNRGHGECKSPVSNIESCTEESRLLLSFQACPDVLGTESTVEELTCLATWKDGNSRYLVGLVSHHHALSNEERYRCFVYDKLSSLMGAFPGGLSSSNLKDAEYKLAQSGDATCNGLDSAEVGSRIMTLRKPPPAERCDFPVWFKGPRHWHALMGNAVYNYHPNDGSMHIIKSNGYMETRALCEQINKQTSTEMMAVVHYTTGCKSGFMCMIFYRRDTHVIEIQSGIPASRLEDACAPDYFDINKMPYITLLANNPDPQICPLEGLYNLRGAIGPPYITSRHKRNHNNKGHNQHGHHHHELGHKRHGTLNFRNSEEQQLGSSGSAWHTKSPSELAIRNRRASHVIIPPASVPLSSSSLSSSSTSSSSPNELETTISNSKNDSSTNGNGHHDTIDGSGRNIGNIGNSGHSTKSTSRQLNLDESQSAKITIIMDKENEKENHHHQNFHQQKQEQQQTSSSINAIVNSGSGSSNKVIDDVRRFNESQRNRRNAPGCIVNYNAQRQLWIGCTGPNLIDVRPQCDEEGNEEYSCHGSWSENGTTYVIARHKGTKHGVCISYRPLEGNAAKLVIGDACYRGILNPPEHHLVANLTVYGKCGDTSSSNTNPCTDWILMLLTTAIILSITIFTNR